MKRPGSRGREGRSPARTLLVGRGPPRHARLASRSFSKFLLETAHRDEVVRLLRDRAAEAPDGRRWREEPRLDPVPGILEARWTIASAAGTPSFTARLRPYTATELGELLGGRRGPARDVSRDLDGGPPSLAAYTIVAVGER